MIASNLSRSRTPGTTYRLSRSQSFPVVPSRSRNGSAKSFPDPKGSGEPAERLAERLAHLAGTTCPGTTCGNDLARSEIRITAQGKAVRS